MPYDPRSDEYARSSALLRNTLTAALEAYDLDEGQEEGIPEAVGLVADIPSVHIEATDLRDYAVDIARGLQYFRETDPRFDLAIDGEELVTALEEELLPAVQSAIRDAVMKVAERSTARYGRPVALDEAPRRPRLGR